MAICWCALVIKGHIGLKCSKLTQWNKLSFLLFQVNISTFDERYQMLEQALQDALQRLDQFMEKETTLTNSLNKLHTDLDSKMDSEAEKKLKKFMGEKFILLDSLSWNLFH